MPSDAIWIGVITGGVGLGGILATSFTALRLDRRRQLAERKRAREQHDREQRNERGSAYYRTIALVNRLDRFATGSSPDDNTVTATIDEYNRSVSALRLLGVGPVLDALRDLQRLTRGVDDSMTTQLPRGESLVDAFAAAWNGWREEIMEAERRLIAAMRQDVGPYQPNRQKPD